MRRLILFAKRPRIGRVKTRLVPPLSPDQALALYRVFLADSARLVSSFGNKTCRVELCLDGRFDPGALPEEAARLPLTEQGAGDLGQRLSRAFVRAAGEGSSATVVIGADAPNLPRSHIDDALGHLTAGADAVMGPAVDGGYVLIGLRWPSPELFRDIPWGGSGVAETTRRRARDLGLPLLEISPWYDVDDPSALRRLRNDLSGPGAASAPATAAHLRSLDGVYSAML